MSQKSDDTISAHSWALFVSSVTSILILKHKADSFYFTQSYHHKQPLSKELYLINPGPNRLGLPTRTQIIGYVMPWHSNCTNCSSNSTHRLKFPQFGEDVLTTTRLIPRRRWANSLKRGECSVNHSLTDRCSSPLVYGTFWHEKWPSTRKENLWPQSSVKCLLAASKAQCILLNASRHWIGVMFTCMVKCFHNHLGGH